MCAQSPVHPYGPAVPDEAALLKTGALQSAIFNSALDPGDVLIVYSDGLNVLRHSGPSPTTANGE